MIKSEIRIPLLNANEPEARLAAVYIKDQQAVQKGTLLFTIETTKAAMDMESPDSGFVRVEAREGDTLSVGDILAFVTDTADEALPQAPLVHTSAAVPSHSEVRITKPARALALSLGVDLASLPTDRLVTEEVVRQFAGVVPEISLLPADKPYLLIYGGGGHAKSILEMVYQAGNYAIAGIVDDGIPAGRRVLGIPVVGTRAVLPALTAQGVKLAANGVGGILDIHIRVKIFELLEASGFQLPALIHPHAAVEPSARIGDGAQVFANAYVGSEAVLHPKCMVNTNAVVSHDCEIGSYTHIAPGALLAGLVHVGERSLVGMGVTTAIGVRIGNNVRIGNGAIILEDVPDKTIIQAGKSWVGNTKTIE